MPDLVHPGPPTQGYRPLDGCRGTLWTRPNVFIGSVSTARSPPGLFTGLARPTDLPVAPEVGVVPTGQRGEKRKGQGNWDDLLPFPLRRAPLEKKRPATLRRRR